MFTLHLEPHARQDLAGLDPPVRQRLPKRLDWLVELTRPGHGSGNALIKIDDLAPIRARVVGVARLETAPRLFDAKRGFFVNPPRRVAPG